VPRPEAPAGLGWWHCLGTRDGVVTRFSIVPVTVGGVPTGHPDGTRVTLPEDEAAAMVDGVAACTAHLVEGRVERLVLAAPAESTPASLWFVERPEPVAAPPAVALIAFTGHDVDPGSVLRKAPRGITSADQVAAIRWYVGTGEVDQMYVAPASRRQGIASTLPLVAGTFSIATGGQRLWGDGQRTADGERVRNASTWAHRAVDQTHLAPPMTPFEDR